MSMIVQGHRLLERERESEVEEEGGSGGGEREREEKRERINFVHFHIVWCSLCSKWIQESLSRRAEGTGDGNGCKV